MTALEEYSKLEASARYFDGRSAHPREVVISFGERTLMIVGFDDQPLAHWPLASLRSVGEPSGQSVQLVPDPQSDEKIVLEDPEMVSAITQVCQNLHRRPMAKRNGRRLALWCMAALGSGVLILFLLIPAIADQLANYVPLEREQALGDAIVARISQTTDAEGDGRSLICNAPEGLAALNKMMARIKADVDLPYAIRVSVLDQDTMNAVALPGGHILIFRGLIDAVKSPEEVAGVYAHQVGHVINRDPILSILRAAETAEIMDILFGDVSGASVVEAATDAVLNASHPRESEQLADDVAYRLLQQAELPSIPLSQIFHRLDALHGSASEPMHYLSTHPGADNRAERAAIADRVGSGTYEPVLSDRDWIALTSICDQRAAL